MVCCRDGCHYSYCEKCLLNNMGRLKYNEITESDDWNCFKCDSAQIQHYVDYCIKVTSGERKSKTPRRSAGRASEETKEKIEVEKKEEAAANGTLEEPPPKKRAIAKKSTTQLPRNIIAVSPQKSLNLLSHVNSSLKDETSSDTSVKNDAAGAGDAPAASPENNVPSDKESEEEGVETKIETNVRMLEKSFETFITDLKCDWKDQDGQDLQTWNLSVEAKLFDMFLKIHQNLVDSTKTE